VSPKKKLFNRRRKKLLELQCFLSVDWYKQQTMRVLLNEHRHHIQVPPRRSAYVRAVCSSETIRYAHKRAHKEVTQNDEAADGRAHRRGRDSYAYMIVNTVSLFWRKEMHKFYPSSSPPPFVFARLMMRMQEFITRVEKKMDDGKKG
jgi:hypothetical protein